MRSSRSLVGSIDFMNSNSSSFIFWAVRCFFVIFGKQEADRFTYSDQIVNCFVGYWAVPVTGWGFSRPFKELRLHLNWQHFKNNYNLSIDIIRWLLFCPNSTSKRQTVAVTLPALTLSHTLILLLHSSFDEISYWNYDKLNDTMWLNSTQFLYVFIQIAKRMIGSPVRLFCLAFI